MNATNKYTGPAKLTTINEDQSVGVTVNVHLEKTFIKASTWSEDEVVEGLEDWYGDFVLDAGDELDDSVYSHHLYLVIPEKGKGRVVVNKNGTFTGVLKPPAGLV